MEGVTYKVTSRSLRDTDVHLRRLGSDNLSSYRVLTQEHLTTISLINGYSGAFASHLKGGGERDQGCGAGIGPASGGGSRKGDVKLKEQCLMGKHGVIHYI